jgi:hypothetical protein
METLNREAAFLEEAVCNSKDRELHIFCHAQSGRGWVEVGGRRFVGKSYVQAARRLHSNNKLALKHTDTKRETFELGHHVCARAGK